jgi:hypothetical protein
MNTATQNDALRNALIRAGQRLATNHVHGRFRIARRGCATFVSFHADGDCSANLDVAALTEAVVHARSAGFKAERMGLEAWIAA